MYREKNKKIINLKQKERRDLNEEKERAKIYREQNVQKFKRYEKLRKSRLLRIFPFYKTDNFLKFFE